MIFTQSKLAGIPVNCLIYASQAGTASDPSAEVIQPDPGKKVSMFFFKADDNVLFLLDNKKKLMPGNEDFSYVLYRTEN